MKKCSKKSQSEKENAKQKEARILRERIKSMKETSKNIPAAIENEESSDYWLRMLD